VTGLIKSNLPGRICFKVASKMDSRSCSIKWGRTSCSAKATCCSSWPGNNTLVRAQCTYLAGDEITKIVAHLETDEPCFSQELLQLETADVGEGAALDREMRARDRLRASGRDRHREGRGSVSLLQRRSHWLRFARRA